MVRSRQFLFLFLIGALLPSWVLAIGNLSVGFATGTHDASVLSDSLLYVATQRGIDVYGLGDPHAPLLLASFDTPGICSHVTISDDLLAAGDGRTVLLYSLVDPINPSLLAWYGSTRTFTAIDFQDSLIAVATIPNGVLLLHYTGSSLDSVSRIPFNEAVTALALSDTLLIIGLVNSGISIYRIADPAQPELLLPSLPVQVNDLAVADDVLCCASGNGGVRIFTISNPCAPETLSSYVPGDFILSVTVTDSFLCCSGLTDSLYVAHIGDPASPYHHCTFPAAAVPLASFTDGEILSVSEGSTGELFSLSQQTAYASLDPFEPVTAAVLTEEIAFVAVQDRGLAILDISLPQTPTIISWYAHPGPIERILVRDTLAFLSGGDAGLSIVNVSDPAAPSLVAGYDTPGTLWGSAKRGATLFLADGGSGIQALSITDVYHPAFLDSLLLPGDARDIALAGSLAFVALGPKGFASVVVEDPQNLFVADTVSDAGFSTCLAAGDSFLFLGTRNATIPVYDLFTWASPQLVTMYPAPGPVRNLFLSNHLLFAACDEGGIQIIDVSDPYAPVCFDSLDTPGTSITIHPFLHLIGTADRFSFRIDSFAFEDTVPPAPVSNLSLDARDSLIVLRWHNPADADYKGTRVVFKNDTFPVHPDDGTVLLDHTAEPASPDSFNHTGLPGDSARFYYAVFAYDLALNYAQPALASAISASDTVPPGEVNQISFTFSDHLLEVHFMTPNDADLWGVRAVYDTTHIPQDIFDGEEFFDGPFYPNSAYVETLTVDHNRTYHFTFFAKDSVPNFSQGASASCQTIDTVPPGEVTFQLVQFFNYRVRIVFRTPNNADFTGVRACYDLERPPPHPDSGTLFFDELFNPDSTVLRELETVVMDTVYYFTFFSEDTALNFSPGKSCTCATEPDTFPPDTVLQFTVTGYFPDTVKLSWVNPADTGLYYVKLKYDIDTYPETPDSGYNIKNEVVAPGQPDSVTWNPGKPGVNLFFSAFSFDRWGNASTGVHAWCTTPTLTTLTQYDPVDGGTASWRDTVRLTFGAPIQQATLQGGVELAGNHPYDFTVDRGTGNTYLLIPPSFASLDTVTITLHHSILDSIGNPFDGNGNGLPDSVDDCTWNFFSIPICDYVRDDTINAEDFGVLRNALDTQDITKEVGPCSGSVPSYVLMPDSAVDFEDFAIFIMMWNWSLDTRGIPLVSFADAESLICFQQQDTILSICATRKEALIGGEIIIHRMGNNCIGRGNGIGGNDLFIARQVEEDLSLSFGIMDEMPSAQIATVAVSSPIETLDYAYRLVYADTVKEGRGRRAVEGSVPAKTMLRSPHPNPGTRFTFAFGIPKHMRVSLNLYDAAGRKAATLLNRELQAGYHRVTLDSRTQEPRLSAGIYFLRLQTEDASLVQKIILLR